MMRMRIFCVLENDKRKSRGRVFIPVSALLALLVLWSVYQRFDVFFWCGDGLDAKIFYQIIQHIGGYKCRKGGAQADVFDSQMKQGQ